MEWETKWYQYKCLDRNRELTEAKHIQNITFGKNKNKKKNKN